MKDFLSDGVTRRCSIPFNDGRQCSFEEGHKGMHRSYDAQQVKPSDGASLRASIDSTKTEMQDDIRKLADMQSAASDHAQKQINALTDLMNGMAAQLATEKDRADKFEKQIGALKIYKDMKAAGQPSTDIQPEKTA